MDWRTVGIPKLQLLGGIAVGLLTHRMSESLYFGMRPRLIILPTVPQAACLVVSAHLRDRMASAEVVPFVYLQF